MDIDRTATIHSSAIVEDGAKIGAGAYLGPFCHIGPHVELGEHVTLKSHVVVVGRTRIGASTTVWPFASLGHQPQDLKYAGEDTSLVIGANNMIREHVTMSPGTAGGGGVTRIGDGGLFMMSSHVGHDCQLGNNVIIANNAPLAGHVELADNVVIGGNAAIHQFCRIGRGAMIGGLTGVEKDIAPFTSAIGDRAALGGLNLIGLKRAGVSRDDIHALRGAYKAIFTGEGEAGLAGRARDAAASEAGKSPLVAELVAFLLSDSKRGFCTARKENHRNGD